MKKTLTLMIAASALALSACSKKPPAELPPAPVGTPQTQNTTPVPVVPQGPTPGSQADFLNKVAADRVFFGTDQSDLDADARATLDSQAKWLAQYPNVKVTVEGHCDERGTREYNLALGDRRATAAKNYLATAGVAVSRINTISYGKERPDALGSDEAAWAKNRRAVTITVQ